MHLNYSKNINIATHISENVIKNIEIHKMYFKYPF